MEDAISQDEVESRIDSALDKLVSQDRYLFETKLGERCIAHRFAVHLADVFPNWDVDCEYNRNGHLFKEIRLTEECRALLRKSDRVVPDIVVHKRGASGPNLVAIEIKRAGQPGKSCDLAKLRGYMCLLGYSYGLYVCFDAGPVAQHIEERIIFSKADSS